MVDEAARINILGVPVDLLRSDEVIARLRLWRVQASQKRLFYANAHVCNLAYSDGDFLRAMRAADIVICEGVGLQVGARLTGQAVPELIQTMDWIDDLLVGLVADDARVFLLGDERFAVLTCADKMKRRHPGLNIVGVHDGFFDMRGTANTAVMSEIRDAQPDVLLVGMGSPRQEFWIEENRHELQVPAILALGALFRWYAGIENRAPAWMLRRGLWWLHRLVNHPIRHFRRYVIGNPLFIWRVLRQR